MENIAKIQKQRRQLSYVDELLNDAIQQVDLEEKLEKARYIVACLEDIKRHRENEGKGHDSLSATERKENT